MGDVVTTSTSIAPLPTTVLLSPTTSVPVVPPDATTTTRPRPAVTSTTPTTLRPTSPTTAVPRTTSTSTTVPAPLRMCQPGEVVVTATPDRASYPPGTTVNVLVAAQNRSSLPCQPLDPSLELRDAAGANCVGLGCPPGAYTATAVFGPFRSSPAPFTLT